MAQAFEVMKSQKGCDILKTFSHNERKIVREKMINAVLSTDMAKH
jgi:hypothetical protein